MLFAHAFDRPSLLSRIRRFRQNSFRVYAWVLAAVVAATLVRLALHAELSSTSPFTIYSLAVLCMSMLGGFAPGMVTLTGSIAVGSVLFLPPAFSLSLAEGAEWPLIMFALVGITNVVLVSGLMAATLLHDEQQQFLMRELEHRSKNLFTVVQGIVSRTLLDSQSLAQAKQALETRLAALARTHAILAASEWTGASLNHIVAEELVSFSNQVTCTGCDVPLNTPSAQNFALILHELATNAIKHGALSRPEGRIAVEGRVQPDDGQAAFHFTWSEYGGPAPKPGCRKGFGSSILDGMARRFARHVATMYRAEGLLYELQVPLNAIEASSAASTRRGER